MPRGEYDWDDGNIDKIRDRHGVEPDEVEEAIGDSHGFGIPAYNVGGERRYGWIGATESGRVLEIVYTMRNRKVRPISARDADATEKRRYRSRS